MEFILFSLLFIVWLATTWCAKPLPACRRPGWAWCPAGCAHIRVGTARRRHDLHFLHPPCIVSTPDSFSSLLVLLAAGAAVSRLPEISSVANSLASHGGRQTCRRRTPAPLARPNPGAAPSMLSSLFCSPQVEFVPSYTTCDNYIWWVSWGWNSFRHPMKLYSFIFIYSGLAQ